MKVKNITKALTAFLTMCQVKVNTTKKELGQLNVVRGIDILNVCTSAVQRDLKTGKTLDQERVGTD